MFSLGFEAGESTGSGSTVDVAGFRVIVTTPSGDDGWGFETAALVVAGAFGALEVVELKPFELNGDVVAFAAIVWGGRVADAGACRLEYSASVVAAVVVQRPEPSI